MKTLELEIQQVDPKAWLGRHAAETDYRQLVTEPTLILEAGTRRPLIYYGTYGLADPQALAERLEQLKFGQINRTGGVVTETVQVGAVPRVTIRRDFCTKAKMARENPALHDQLAAEAGRVAEQYAKIYPELHDQHARQTREHVQPEYQLPGGIFTSGVINRNSPIQYHLDRGNYPDVWSGMIVLKRDCGGGYLSVPQLGLGFQLADNTVFFFDGQSLIHGVTPIGLRSARSYRYSIVFYSLKAMWRCQTEEQELARIKSVRTERERRRAGFVQGPTGAPNFPVFVVSRGRAGVASTPKLLEQSQVPYALWVEPQEVQAYREAYPKCVQVLALPESGRGIAYSRQQLLQFCRKKKFGKYWQLDDNLLGFFTVKGGRQAETTASEVLRGVEREGAGPRVALAGPEYRQYAWDPKGGTVRNTRVYCCTLTRTDTGIDYREALAGKEDVDFVIQHLVAGWETLLTKTLSMGKVAMGKNRQGGLTEYYRTGGHSKVARKLHEAWPDLTKVVDKGQAGLDVRVDWRRFKQGKERTNDGKEPQKKGKSRNRGPAGGKGAAGG